MHYGRLSTTVITDGDALEALGPAWDDLAVECSHPYCAHAWLSPWWRHVAPEDARLRVVVIADGGDVIGVAPWFVRREHLGIRTVRPMGWPILPAVEPLAAQGRQLEVAAAVAEALAGSGSPPDLIALDRLDRRSGWPGDLAKTWPGGPAAMLTRYEQPTFALSLTEGEGFASWLAGKSRNFRNNLGYKRRRFLRSGGRVRMATPETLESDLRAFVRLHQARWEGRGGSRFVQGRVEQLLTEAGRALLPRGQFRLWSLDIDGEVIASHLGVRAGGEYAYWLGGFDERYAALSPSLLGILALVEDAFACDARRIDFGGGSANWKHRFADDVGTLAWRRVVPRGHRHALARASLAPGQWRRALAKRVPSDLRARALTLERRVASR